MSRRQQILAAAKRGRSSGYEKSYEANGPLVKTPTLSAVINKTKQNRRLRRAAPRPSPAWLGLGDQAHPKVLS